MWAEEAPVVFAAACSWSAVHKQHRLTSRVAAELIIQLVAISNIEVAVAVGPDFWEQLELLHSS